jgi:methyl-accepting chemotaxis protein
MEAGLEWQGRIVPGGEAFVIDWRLNQCFLKGFNMVPGFDRKPIAQQLILAILAALVVVFAVMTWIVQQRAASAALRIAEHNLRHEVQLMAGTLDSFFMAVKARGDRQSEFFLKQLPGKPTLGTELIRTGDVDLPVLRVGGEIMNANDRPLLAFRALTGDDTAFLLIRDGKLYRINALLRKPDGSPTHGVPLPGNDPVTRAILAGQDYQGLVIRAGKYYLATVRLLKDEQGKPWGAYSVRISLEEELARIRAQFGALVAGKTGYVTIARAGDAQGAIEFVLHPRWQDKTLAESDLSPEASAAVSRMVKEKQGTFLYADADGSSQRDRIMVAETASSWGWTVMTGSWLDEYLDESYALRNLLIGISGVAALVLALIVFFLVNSRLRGLTQLVGEVSRVSSGDLRATVQDAEPGSRNEVHAIAHAFNEMARSMRQLVSGVYQTSGQVGVAAHQLQDAAQLALESASTASQSASGIAASVQQLSVSISQVADNANEAARISEEAKLVTTGGRQVVERAMNELDRVATEIGQSASLIESLGERSKQISNVISVIRDIADQTNLLALNAAIEAARAGEQGRGFAVVADEVRKLAERTSLSTQEISSTVNAILQETANAVERMQSVRNNMSGSVELAQKAGESLHTIDSHAEQTVGVVLHIADGTREQSAAGQEIARLVERIAQAAEGANDRARSNRQQASELERLSAELQAQLSRFKV